MAARIRSLINGLSPVDEASRDDLLPADVITVQAVDAATTYAWALMFVPEGSSATFSGSATAISPGSFTVDLPGPYLVRLVVDATLPTESQQYVRLRALTTSLGLKLVAAGERRDDTGIVPVDADPVGWAYNQNYNLLALESAVAAVTNAATAWKAPVRAATVSDVSLASGTSPLIVDGVTLGAGNRVAAWNQTLGSENGVYEVLVPGTGSDGIWARAADFDSSPEVTGGTCFFVQEGTINALTRLTLVTAGTIVLGTTSLSFIQEGPLVRTDATSTEIIAAGTPFTAGTIVWSSQLNTRDYREISVWFNPTSLGSNTQVTLYAQWSDDGTTIPFDDNNGIQQTDFLIANNVDGTFKPKDYQAVLTTASLELAANKIVMLSYPKKGGKFRFGVKGTHASGAFGVRALRLG